uniref:DNA ligase (NAD(+)) n=1 Tax=viral metagenome TaxID=1070528 RepID=A0A6C0D8A9_9ZZZZ
MERTNSTKKKTKKIDNNASKNNSTKKMNAKPKTLTLANVLEKRKMAAFKELSENPIPYLEKQSTETIAKLIKEASYKYYEGNPPISDDIFDIMKNYLSSREPNHEVLKEIGASAPGEKVKLPYYMGSLDKIREDEKALESWKSKHGGKVVISDKLDGNSALLVYSSKGTIKMYSRGDGFEGQDISHLIPIIQGVPKNLKECAIRGELIISKDNWKTKGKGANARNAVAGVMHSKHPDKVLASIVEFVAYEQLHPRIKISESIGSLKDAGFHVVYNQEENSSDLTMDNLSKILIDRRLNSPYEVDGIVIFHDDNHNQVSGKNPSYAFAFKSILTHEEAEVIVKEVQWNASKDGYLKPLIYFDPVVLAGATIQKATGFNGQYIESNTIGPGSRIVIIRSGDVIPHIVRVLSKSASGKPSFPDVEYKWNETHVDIMLLDKSKASDVMIKQMAHFASVFDMKGVGSGIVERLYNNGIDTIKKLLSLTVEQLLKMDGFQKKSAEKLVNEIKESLKKADCLTFMVASNLFGRAIGEKKLKHIVTNFPTILQGYKPTETELSKVDGIGSVTATQFLDGLPLFFDFMKDIGIPCDKKIEVKPVVISTKSSLSHLIVVFTGMRDKELEVEIESRGGKIGSSVSKKTTVLVAKDPSEDSGKVKTAKELGVEVLDFESFKKKYIE